MSRTVSLDLVVGDRVVTPSTAHSPEDGALGHAGDHTLALTEQGEELWAELVPDAGRCSSTMVVSTTGPQVLGVARAARVGGTCSDGQ